MFWHSWPLAWPRGAANAFVDFVVLTPLGKLSVNARIGSVCSCNAHQGPALMCREPHGSMLLCRVRMCVNHLGLSDSYMKRLSARSVEEKEQLELMHANGKVLVGVTLGERIGKGGFGRVFEGMYCSTPCALKVRSLCVRHPSISVQATPRCEHKQLARVCGAGGWRQWRRRGNLGRNKRDVQSIPPICGARVRHLGRARQGFRSNIHGARGRVCACLNYEWCWLARRP